MTLEPITKTAARKLHNAGERYGVTVDAYPNGLAGAGAVHSDTWASFDDQHAYSASWSRRGGAVFYFAPVAGV